MATMSRQRGEGRTGVAGAFMVVTFGLRSPAPFEAGRAVWLLGGGRVRGFHLDDLLSVALGPVGGHLGCVDVVPSFPGSSCDFPAGEGEDEADAVRCVHVFFRCVVSDYGSTLPRPAKRATSFFTFFRTANVIAIELQMRWTQDRG